MEKSFNYYGFDKTTYYDCIDMIRSTNRKHVFILNTWFLLVNLFYLIFAGLNLFGASQEQIPFYAIYFSLALIFNIFLGFAGKFLERHTITIIYSSMTLMISYGIINSLSHPYMPATIFLIMLTLVAISYIDTLYRIMSMVLLSSGLFLLTSYMYKTFSIAYHDTYNAAILFSLACGLHYTFQRTRLHQFVLYQKDLIIQQELEVKSSFDALTSLLNRGRFFSIAEEVLPHIHEEYMVLCLLDLDGFKEINDNLGHQMGDKAIQIAGKTILDTLNIDLAEKWTFPTRVLEQKGSFAGRLGGDEFIVLIRGFSSQSEVDFLLHQLLKDLNNAKLDSLNGIQASFGATALNSLDTDIDEAYKRADDALYESKRKGKNQIHFINRIKGGAL